MPAAGPPKDSRPTDSRRDGPPAERPERHDDARSEEPTPSRDRKEKPPRRPGLVIGPTTGDADVQLEW